MNNNSEPLLNAEEDRLVIFPIRYPKLWDMYKKMRSAFWIPDDFFDKMMETIIQPEIGLNNKYIYKNIF
jgi:hypothetical protein